jgi:hypothetical protein
VSAPRALGAALAGACLAVAAAGCGGNVEAADLFVVTRSGPHAQLTLLDEEGNVDCNGRRAGKLGDKQIVKARGITEDLEKPASEHLSLPARPGSVFSYRLRDANGSVGFADNSSGQPKVTRELALFVLETAQQVCKLAE